ncbi:type VI secretion system Vgr family protein [Pectobacterium parmentieri WPP163]|uniref:type VI secretion system Vgr family protein n=1 Tax=Pectobacterium parmentieri TaxID=1905730 RepID=UPI0001B0A72D|nr:type VI secretion system tip protein TssI/VgrG [Pectobacterium parmentieri]ACX87793.1 type VI secretion system Vgr family protein [Pectobacterium parmentieri WPP163]
MANRISVNTTEGDGLRFWKLEGREAISEPFVWTLTLLSENTQINRSKLLSQSVTITIPTQNVVAPRYLNGKITSVGATPIEHGGTRYAVYTLTVESDLWPMKRNRDMRIFQGKTVPEIIKEIISEHNVNVDERLTENYRIWEYCVQYQESSLDFISRLMEQEGIAFHFLHDIDSHTLVLTDSGTELQPFSGYEIIPYHQTPSGGVTGEEGISQWFVQDNITPGLYSLDDYDFRKPNAWLFQARQNNVAPQPGTVSVYDWPGRYVDHNHGDRYARIHQERWQVEHQQTSGTSNASAVAPGHIFRLKNAPFPDHNSSYLITNATYQFEENPYSTSDTSSSTQKTDFTVIPAVTPYRPEQTTPWPRTYGPQTAKVVGPTGESIWTDNYGRVKVKFHWDRQAKGDDTSSCWIRVSSAWAGQGFGGVQIPRIGDEVVVDFINGDPDRPIITGRVYNKSSMPPWELPAAATVMGFMTRSKDGNNDNGSHLLFEDKAGSEKIALHAEKDMTISVENNKTVEIDGSRTTTIKGEQKDDVTSAATFHYRAAHTTTVEGEETSVFNNTQTETIKNGRKLDITSGGDNVTIKGERNTDIDGTEIHHVTGKLTENYDSGQITTIKKGGRKDTIDGGVTIDVNGGDWIQNIEGKTELNSKDEMNINSKATIKIKSPSVIIDSPSVTYTHKKEKSYWDDISSVKLLSVSLKGLDISISDFSAGLKGVNYSKTAFDISTKDGQIEFINAIKLTKSAVKSYINGLTTFF